MSLARDTPKEIYLKDYQQPSHWIRKTELSINIYDEYTLVESSLTLEKNREKSSVELFLHGEQLELLEIYLDDKSLTSSDYRVDDFGLTVFNVAETHCLRTVTKIYPQKNTALEGLYKSRLMYCTQCEAEGFRKITYYQDRPDVMSEFTTTISADKRKYPVLLSNGNLIHSGDESDHRHWVTWHDPHLKPCYLFALVVGDLKHIEDTYTTGSGRHVVIRIFVEEKDLNKCDHAMRSLKNAMRWDEEVYGREYDLDIFMIVAVDDFNMGAMENKGLNIFNTSCVLAHPKTSTDAEFQRVEGVVAHEYFHNWSGNRVTCRDWFQLSLKEGFTVFRDACFSADMGSPTVKRVEDVSLLRSLQFAEDAGPMAHAVQPASFIEISNFYTLTIYEKGAEIVRMIHRLLGPEYFRKGCDVYFDRHDGQAVTIEDFVQAMADVSGRDFDQFMLWYRQAGTPELRVKEEYCRDTQQYTLTFKQTCRPTSETQNKRPFLIPVSVSLLGDAGKFALVIDGERQTETDDNTQQIIEISEAEQTFTFSSVPEKPVPVMLRGFSAPVKLHYNYRSDDLVRIVRHEDDGFCRWDAAQQILINEIERVKEQMTSNPSPALSPVVIEVFSELLVSRDVDPAMVALMLKLPTEKYLGGLAKQIDVDAIHHARSCVQRKLAKQLNDVFLACYQRLQCSGPYSSDAASIAARSLKNQALDYLAVDGSARARELVLQQLYQAENMTDELSAFRALVHCQRATWQDDKTSATQAFYEKWQHESLVMNHWFSTQATQPSPNCLNLVKQLSQHDAYDDKNPNKVRALVGAFCGNNIVNFHAIDGSGYAFLTDQIIRLNTLNPQIAARLISPLSSWAKYDETRQKQMTMCLARIQDTQDLSKDVYEVVNKVLKK